MVKKVIWSPRAIASFDTIIKYLQKEWTEKEIIKLVTSTQKVLLKIASGSITFRTSSKQGIHEVLITKHNLLIYRIKKNQIELLVFYDTRRHPKKRRF
jgi:plasmid stabilization system protein ParE